MEGNDEDSLSPEACYECKINGGGKNGRHKRNTDENEIKQVQYKPFPVSGVACFSLLSVGVTV